MSATRSLVSLLALVSVASGLGADHDDSTKKRAAADRGTLVATVSGAPITDALPKKIPATQVAKDKFRAAQVDLAERWIASGGKTKVIGVTWRGDGADGMSGNLTELRVILDAPDPKTGVTIRSVVTFARGPVVSGERTWSVFRAFRALPPP